MERVTDGARTRDIEDHNLALYQLSYGHQLNAISLILMRPTASHVNGAMLDSRSALFYG